MNPAKPLVSLCMATCLRSDLFPACFAALLAQTYAPLEILVLADGSNEASLALLKNCRDVRLRWIATPKPSGMVRAWNTVCRESKGKYFLFCADDDVLLPHAIEQQVELLEEHSDVGFCHADFVFIDDDDQEIGRWISHEGTWVKTRREEWPRYLVQTRCCMQTTVVRREAWDKVNGWDEDAGNPGDNSLYLKLLRDWNVGHVNHLACQYRIRTRSPDSWEKQYRNVREYHALAIKHLNYPPHELAVPLGTISNRLHARLSRMAIPLLQTRGVWETEQKELRRWLKGEVWSKTTLGSLFHFLDRVGGLEMLAQGGILMQKLRAFARTLLRHS